MTVSTWILLFFFYSFLGWLCEEVFVSIGRRKLVNRGFLYGPVTPIYGFGAILMIVLHTWVAHPVWLFLLSTVLLSALEYGTSVLLERLFHLRLWDYSHRRFQLHGRICLRNSLLFGALAIGVCYFVQPWVMSWMRYIPLGDRRTMVFLLLVIGSIDLLMTIFSLLSVRQRLRQLQGFLTKELQVVEQSVANRIAQMQAAGEEEWEQFRKNFKARSSTVRRFMRAYPRMQARTEGVAEAMRALLPNTAKKEQEIILSHVKVQPRIRYNEKGQPLFGQSASFARYFFVFLIGCVLGYFLEEIFCLLQNGMFESRQGLLYGPLNQIYGLGLVIMVAFLDGIPTRSHVVVFLSCAFLGGAIEYFASYFQERFFGTVSWDYTGSFLSIGGRTNFIFILLWGLAGVVAMRYVMPWLCWLIESIPPRSGKRIMRVLAVLILLDILITVPAVYRYTERSRGIEATTEIGAFFDQHYPDAYMKTVFPNMMF